MINSLKPPLLGATIEILNLQEIRGIITNENGIFSIDEVPIGRQTIRISYIGYETIVRSNIEVTTGKNVYINAALQESFSALSEVVIANKPKATDQEDDPLYS